VRSRSSTLRLELSAAPARPRPRWADVAAAAPVWLAAALVAAAFAWIVVDLALGGLSALSWSFLVEAPERAGRAGGIAPILVSTLLILGTCIAVAMPLGLGTAVLLAEFTRSDGAFARAVSFSLDVLAGVPSIVFGLFGHAFFCQALGLGYSILAGGLTLACMTLPILVRSGCAACPTTTGWRARRSA